MRYLSAAPGGVILARGKHRLIKLTTKDLESLNQETGRARERFLQERDLDSWFEYFERLIQVRQAQKRLHSCE